ncbi:MAG: ferritin family protein [Desulfomonile sp.]|nr:ferritin family protein [Desulfomonile sp.]
MTETGDRSLKMLAAALEKEVRGRDFYVKAVATCTNELGRDIFRILTAEEGVHIRRVKEIYEGLSGGKPWSGEWKNYRMENENLQALFRKRMRNLGSKIKADTGDLEALDIGLKFEQGAIDFYKKELGKATDPLEQEFIEVMIREEQSHYASLADVKLYLMNPESWYIETERHTLDGA